MAEDTEFSPGDGISVGTGFPQSTPSIGVAAGAQAVAHLVETQQLAAVAEAYGTTAHVLTELLQTDTDLKLDTGSNNLFYKCTGLASVKRSSERDSSLSDHNHHHRRLREVNVEAADPLPSTLALTTTGVPILHSRSSSKRKIYLDFDGHTTKGTAWNSQCATNSAGDDCICRTTNTCGTIKSPAFNYDGVAGFSNIEKRMIV